MIMKFRRSLFCLILFYALLSPNGFAQKAPNEIKNKAADEFRVDTARPGVYMEFVRYGKRRPIRSTESDQGIWLRLVNNSKFQIRFCSFGVSKTGERLIAADNETEVGVMYDIERTVRQARRESDSGVPFGYNSGSCFLLPLESGKALIFSLPAEHLATGLSVRLSYLYEWEAVYQNEPEHIVRFHSERLPKT